MVKPSFFTPQIHFAWLLRNDVRKKLLVENPTREEARKEFLVWWLLFGRKEYPNFAGYTAEQAAIANEVVGLGGDIKITRIMHHLICAREDVWKSCASGEELDWANLIGWYFAFGVPEYDLFPFVDAESLDYLLAAAPGIVQDTSLPISRLMFWLWRSRPDVRAAFSLGDTESRERFLAWYYTLGIKENNLFGYLSLPLAFRLCEPAPLIDRSMESPITRIMWYYWLADPAKQAGYDLRTPDGRNALRLVTDTLLRSTPAFRPLWDILHSRKSPVPIFETEPLDFGTSASAKMAKLKLAESESRPFGVNLVGYALGELGIGEDVRMMAKALEAVGIEFCILNRQPGPEIRQMDFSVARHLARDARYPITVVCMTAFDTTLLWLDRPDLFRDTYVIGFWPWELPRWPEEWAEVYGLVDEIWCSSRYTLDAFADAKRIPVIQMPMAVTVEAVAEKTREQFGLPENRFLFLFVFDFMSYPARKNPYACIDAFRQAFPDGDEPVNLVLKISNIVPDSPRWSQIKAACEVDSRILILDKNLDKGSVLGLMRVCDAYLSLHRAEGFGRTLAEAMLLGKPVIATGYSGNADYLTEATGYPISYNLIDIDGEDYPCGEGQVWAEPDTAVAAARMREVFGNRRAASERSRAGCSYIGKKHSPEAVGQLVLKRLKSLARPKRSSGKIKTT